MHVFHNIIIQFSIAITMDKSLIIKLSKKENMPNAIIMYLVKEKAWFRSGRCTVGQIEIVRILRKSYSNPHRELHHNVIDYKKAFDIVWRNAQKEEAHHELWAGQSDWGIATTAIRCLPTAVIWNCFKRQLELVRVVYCLHAFLTYF